MCVFGVVISEEMVEAQYENNKSIRSLPADLLISLVAFHDTCQDTEVLGQIFGWRMMFEKRHVARRRVMTCIWAIYNDLSQGHPKWWFSRGILPKMALN